MDWIDGKGLPDSNSPESGFNSSHRVHISENFGFLLSPSHVKMMLLAVVRNAPADFMRSNAYSLQYQFQNNSPNFIPSENLSVAQEFFWGIKDNRR